MLIERYVGLLNDLSERKKRNVDRAKKCGFHCKPLIKDEDSDRWWDWWLRLEIVRSVKTVWATSPILRFHSSPVDSVSGSSVCRGFVNPRELHHLRSNPISEWGFHLQAPPPRPVSQVMRQTSRVESANQIGFPEGSFEGFFVTNSLFGGDVQSTWYSFRSWRNPVSDKRPGRRWWSDFHFFVEILWTRISNKVVFCISGSCWKPIRTLQFEAQELSSASLHCCPSISVFVNYAPTMLSFIICFCHRAILATFDDQVLCKVNWQERTWAIFIMRNVDRNGGTRFRW